MKRRPPPFSTSLPELRELVAEYLAETDLAPGTVAARRQLLAAFIAWLETSRADLDHLDQALDDWTAAGVKDGARHNYLITNRIIIGAFYKYGRKWGQLPPSAVVNPLRTLIPSPSRRGVITTEEYARLHAYYAQAENPDWEYWPDAMRIAWETGARLSDVALMERSAIDLVARVFSFEPRKMRRYGQRLQVPLSDDLCAHLAERMSIPIEKGWKHLREQYVLWRMAREYLERRHHRLSAHFQSICERCGIRGKSFHSFRHRRVTSLLEAGHSVPVVQSITGHSLKTLLRYSHIGIDAKRQALESVP